MESSLESLLFSSLFIACWIRTCCRLIFWNCRSLSSIGLWSSLGMHGRLWWRVLAIKSPLLLWKLFNDGLGPFGCWLTVRLITWIWTSLTRIESHSKNPAHSRTDLARFLPVKAVFCLVSRCSFERIEQSLAWVLDPIFFPARGKTRKILHTGW